MTKPSDNEELLARWLNHDLSDVELAKLEASGEPNNLRLVVDDIGTWSLPPVDTEKGLAQIHASTNQESKTVKLSSNRSWIRYAAAVAFFILSYIGWNYFQGRQKITWQTAIGETNNFELPDGSKVSLDAASQITFRANTWEGNRTLYLEGQAFFDVIKGGDFTVNTKLAKVTVIGTNFNIRVSPNTFKATCYQGKVLVSDGVKRTILQPGESLSIENNQWHPSKTENSQPDWLSGFTNYQQVPLVEVVNDLQRHYQINIELTEDYARLKFSGNITHSSLEEALKTLFIPMEITYSLNENGNVVFTN